MCGGRADRCVTLSFSGGTQREGGGRNYGDDMECVSPAATAHRLLCPAEGCRPRPAPRSGRHRFLNVIPASRKEHFSSETRSSPLGRGKMMDL
uniref:Uncharacterized protein n=1 Tax=Knipowitschia caucasica TaxID=637954 RepID=A0AAV2KSJ9_KNICA